MSFDHIPQYGHIYISAQQAGAVPHGRSLGFWKSALREIGTEIFIERRASGLGQIGPRRLWFRPAMAQSLSQTEGMHQYFHRPTPHTGGNLAAQQTGG